MPDLDSLHDSINYTPSYSEQPDLVEKVKEDHDGADALSESISEDDFRTHD